MLNALRTTTPFLTVALAGKHGRKGGVLRAFAGIGVLRPLFPERIVLRRFGAPRQHSGLARRAKRNPAGPLTLQWRRVYASAVRDRMDLAPEVLFWQRQSNSIGR
jgi:hypothetical protein